MDYRRHRWPPFLWSWSLDPRGYTARRKPTAKKGEARTGRCSAEVNCMICNTDFDIDDTRTAISLHGSNKEYLDDLLKMFCAAPRTTASMSGVVPSAATTGAMTPENMLVAKKPSPVTPILCRTHTHTQINSVSHLRKRGWSARIRKGERTSLALPVLQTANQTWQRWSVPVAS